MLSNKGNVLAADNLGIPNPKIPANGTELKASPFSTETAPNI